MYKIYNEKTGNPFLDNIARLKNRSLYEVSSNSFKVNTPRGRKRKKYIKNQELLKVMRLIYKLVESRNDKR